MGLLNIIRRMALREKLSVREISRRTGLSRNTITKYLSAGTIEPKFAVPERPSKLDPFADKLAGWLKTEAGKSRKQRRTLKQLHADLTALGFTGSYGRVAAFARDWRVEQQTAGRGIFVPLSFRPGEAFQFDWSEDYAVIGGERTRSDRHSCHPYHGSDEMNEAFEVDDPSFVAGCEAAEMLHSAEAALDAVAVSVGDFVMRNDELA
jgi:transcriptional regulator with XRE-family HTH domain